jgi:hypothetical protein
MRHRTTRLAAGAFAASIMIFGIAATPAAAASTPPSVAAAAVFPIVQGSSAPLGDLSVTEAAPGQLQVGNVLTFRFSDASNGATLHFTGPGTVSGTNGLAATVALSSSSASLNDEMQVTITAASGSSAFPGVLTLSGLTATADPTAALGNDTVTITGPVFTAPVTTSDASVIGSGTTKATYAAQSTPTVLPTENNQSAGIVTITEPVKSYFHTGDVITLNLRDATGSANSIGLAGTPYAGGGSMTVGVEGLNGSDVQVNDTGFKVDVIAGDPSNGSASSITISNLVLDTAQAPLGPVTLSAAVTAGPDVATALIVPGRVTIANVGGNTTTTSAGTPTLVAGETGQTAANISIAATAGSLVHNDTITFSTSTPGVTFNAATLPVATVTTGDLVLDNATATLGTGDTSVSWKVATGNLAASTIVVGPIVYDVASTATPGTPVQVAVTGEAGSAVTPAQVSNAVIASASPPGSFSAPAATLPSTGAAPFDGESITYTETSAGATPVGASLVLVSPYASQIAAYRTTFAAVPTAATTGLTLGPATVNSSTVLVVTPSGTISAPPQTVVTFPVTAASSGAPGTATISNLAFSLGGLVPPGALVVSGVVEASGGASSLGANQVVDLVNTRNLGTSSATTPPVVSLTEEPPAVTSSSSATFAYISDEAGSTFACALDTVIVSLDCPASITLPSLTDGTHTFSVQAFNESGIGSAVVSYTWTVDTVRPTASLGAPTSLTAPVVVSFSKPVDNVSGSTVILDEVPPTGSPVAVPATMTCTPAAGTAGPCQATDFYASVSLQPVSPLLSGQHYAVSLNPSGITPAIADQAGNILASVTLPFRGSLDILPGSPGTAAAWSVVKSTSATDGSYAEDDVAGAAVSFAFTGTSVTWRTVTGPNQGKASVYVDGVLKKTVNAYSSKTKYKVAETVSGLSSRAHTIRVVVLGKKGATAATGDQVSVDAFVVGTHVTDQTNRKVVQTWSQHTGTPAATYVIDNDAGATYTFSFRGTAVAWYTVVGPTMGKASIYVDGHLVSTVNNGASKLKANVARTVKGLTDAVHVLTIKVLGTHTSVSTGTNIAVARFVVS